MLVIYIAHIVSSYLPSAESTKVLGRFRRHISTELKGDCTNVFTTYFHVEVN